MVALSSSKFLRTPARRANPCSENPAIQIQSGGSQPRVAVDGMNVLCSWRSLPATAHAHSRVVASAAFLPDMPTAMTQLKASMA